MDRTDYVIGIVGAGVMGGGIAQVAAEAGLETILYDIDPTMLERAATSIASSVHRAVEKGKIAPEQAERAVARIKTARAMEDLTPCDTVIEAVPEKIDLKKRLFFDLERATRHDAILATNTSTLSVTHIASALTLPERAIGMHFFNPAQLMPLVEVIAGAMTSAATVEATLALARRMGKFPVRVKDTPGFIVNRVARPFYLEALRVLGEGVTDPATIDQLVREGGGFRMGPFELMDLIGIDTNYAASLSMYEQFFHEPRFRPCLLQQQMVDSGRLGRKTGKGWYDYENP